MRRTILRRMRAFLPTLFLVSVITFLLRVIVPGGPAEALAGAGAQQEAIDQIKQRYGLDRSLVAQYWDWLSGLFHGDLGTSYATGLQVTQVISPRLTSTVEIVALGFLLSAGAGGWLGHFSATHRFDRAGRFVFAATGMGVSLPVFWISTLGAAFFGVKLGVLPANGYVPLSAGFVPHVESIVMPIVFLAVPTAALLARHMRSSMVAALESPYVRTAHAMGISERRINLDLALRNAAAPVVSFVPFMVAGLVGELVIIDAVFVLPGLGGAILDTVSSRDYATLQVIVLMLAVAVLVMTLVADIALTALDPRRRTS